MKNKPERIYLQVGSGDCEDFKEIRDSVTWCEDNIEGSDLSYISVGYLNFIFDTEISKFETMLLETEGLDMRERILSLKKQLEKLKMLINEDKNL